MVIIFPSCSLLPYLLYLLYYVNFYKIENLKTFRFLLLCYYSLLPAFYPQKKLEGEKRKGGGDRGREHLKLKCNSNSYTLYSTVCFFPYLQARKMVSETVAVMVMVTIIGYFYNTIFLFPAYRFFMLTAIILTDLETRLNFLLRSLILFNSLQALKMPKNNQ